MTRKYGDAPWTIHDQKVGFEELEAKLYLPIHMPEAWDNEVLRKRFSKPEGDLKIDFLKIPKNLEPFRYLIEMCICFEHNFRESTDWLWKNYLYLSVKRQWVQPGYSGNRPGWHGDGFGTDDINWIWSDSYPTQIAIQEFKDISPNDVQSMRDMEDQLDSSKIVTYPNNTLIRLDQYVIHNVPEIPAPGGFRTFFKLSISPFKYALKGNSHNYLFDYKWVMHDRDKLRNQPDKGERDYV